jgi:class 3 adenylate cyclase
VERETFVAASVAPAGEDWCERFDACLASATTVTYASQETALDRAHLLAFSAGITMGLALMRAKELRTRPHQLAVWDGQPPGAPVGTAVEVAAWQCLGQPQSIIPCRGGTPLSPPLPRAVKRALPRRVAAMLSGDFVGYRSLSDVQLEAFMVHVLTKLRAALARHQPNVLQASFADGTFFLVLHSAEQAVACAFDLQDAMASVAMAIAALPPSLQMRIGGHFGPVRLEQGPSGQPTVVGSEVTRAAQVEPIAPGACIYVTAQFAAQLALSPEPIAATQYVGVSVGDGHARPMDIFLLTRRQADRSG